MKKDLNLRGYWREAEAYRHFLEDGACNAGIVPYCYGRARIDPAKWPMPMDNDWLYHFRDDPMPTKVLVLEFLPNASPLSIRAITPERAEAALQGLLAVHACCVNHQDISPRNILVLPEGRVVWIDFELAASWPLDYGINAFAFESEMAVAWDILYMQLVCPSSLKFLNLINIDYLLHSFLGNCTH